MLLGVARRLFATRRGSLNSNIVQRLIKTREFHFAEIKNTAREPAGPGANLDERELGGAAQLLPHLRELSRE